ncbi:DUF4373 domain-containing protein [Alistipes sp.]|uniref:DUF4373 domain-containing protein n=1 Tax=Alistipes sp. TaxID=1872444 RepID=UPI003527EEB8
MANIKIGLAYYNVDTDRYQDIRIKRLKKEFRCDGIAVYDYILCEIYRVKGCFITWDESTAFDVAEYFGLKETTVEEIVNYCCNVGLFDKGLRASGSVLTSASIQRRYVEMCRRANRREIVIPNEINIINERCKIISEESPHSSLSLPQRKVKESKEKNYSSSSAHAGEEQQQKKLIFEIFKGRGFTDPAGEVEKFFAYNEACGWKRGGSKIVDRMALAKSWQEQKRDSGTTGRKTTEKLLTYEQMLDRVSAADPMSNWEKVDVPGQKRPMWRRKNS